MAKKPTETNDVITGQIVDGPTGSEFDDTAPTGTDAVDIEPTAPQDDSDQHTLQDATPTGATAEAVDPEPASDDQVDAVAYIAEVEVNGVHGGLRPFGRELTPEEQAQQARNEELYLERDKQMNILRIAADLNCIGVEHALIAIGNEGRNGRLVNLEDRAIVFSTLAAMRIALAKELIAQTIDTVPTE